jgi:hypothetical protein
MSPLEITASYYSVRFEVFMQVTIRNADVSEEPCASIIRVTRIGELGTTLAVISNRCTLRRNIVTLILFVVSCI